MENGNLALIFFTGLTTGGLTCLALQGGLLASAISSQEKAYQEKLERNKQIKATVYFLAAKLVAYTLLGALLGLLGSVVSLSPVARGIMQIGIGIYLVGVAGAMLEIHPLFRYFILKPPKFLARLAKRQTGSAGWLAPAILGAMTVLLPCATTQAMELVALGTGSPLYGAAIMGAFVLGTTPTFFLIGFVFSKAKGVLASVFNKVAAALMIVLALTSINGGLSLTGSVYTFENFWKAATTPIDARAGEVAGAEVVNGVQKVTINVYSSGYSPREVTLKRGVPTKLKLVTSGGVGCARAFTIPSLGIQKVLPVTGETVLEFTPTKKGPLVFACSMGMYTGKFIVI